WHSIALKSDGTVWAWGGNWAGQLGDGSYKSSNIPIKTKELSGIIAISCGGQHNLALKSDGTVWAWGINDKGQLGIGDAKNQQIPIRIPGLNNIVAI
ncbi:hypothetical protein SMA60_26495, partial [Escherichia coli]